MEITIFDIILAVIVYMIVTSASFFAGWSTPALILGGIATFMAIKLMIAFAVVCAVGLGCVVYAAAN